MATKTANVIARIEPEVKEQAESVLLALGIPVSTAITMLYKQIVLRQGIPFPLVLPTQPLARDELAGEAFDNMIRDGLEQARTNQSIPACDAFASLRRGIC